MQLLKELIFLESNYQRVLDERYFVKKTDKYEFVVEHLIFHPLDASTYFTKLPNNTYEFEIDFTVDVQINDLKKRHLASAVADVTMEAVVDGESGKLSMKGKPSVDYKMKYRRITNSAPYEENDDFDLPYEIQDALLSNPVYLKTALARVVTNGENNWREFIQNKLAEIKQDELNDAQFEDE